MYMLLSIASVHYSQTELNNNVTTQQHYHVWRTTQGQTDRRNAICISRCIHEWI